MARQSFQKVGIEPKVVVEKTDDGLIPYVKLEANAGDTPLPVEVSGISFPTPLEVETSGDGYKSEANSVIISLAPGETWNGTFDNALNYGGARIIVYSTQASATDGLKVYCSDNGIDGFLDDQYTIPANKPCTFAATIAEYLRVSYTNGTVAADVRICTLFLKHMSVVSSHRIQDDLRDDDDGQLAVSVMKLRTAQNNYVSGAATNAGNFKVSLEETNGIVVPVAPSDNLSISEFGEQRVAQAGNRSDGEFLYDLQPLLYDNISANGGSATHAPNGRSVLLAVGGTENGRIGGMRKHYWVPYTPGNGQEIDITGTMNAANIAGGSGEVFLRSTVTGVTTLQTVPQSSWTNAANLNWHFSQIFRFSFQSLRVGRIQYVLVRNGIPVKVAEINNDNIRSEGYWQYANLPPYWKIFNLDGKTIAEFGYGDEMNGIGVRYVWPTIQQTATAIAICETVKSQGGDKLADIPGFPFSTDPMLAKTVQTTIIPIISIRVASLFNSIPNYSLIVPQQVEIETTNPINWYLFYRPTLTGASWAATDTHSGTETDTSATAVTGGFRFAAGMVGAGTNQRVQDSGLLGRVLMSLGNTGTADILTLAAVRSGAQNADVRGLFTGKAIR